MKKVIEMRMVNPNNATHELFRYLEEQGVKVCHGRRKYVEINGMKFAVTITSANRQYADCRQFVSNEYNGLITMYEKTGQIYLYHKEQLLIGAKTREFSQSKFQTVQSIKKIQECEPYRYLRQVNTDEYQELYVKVSEELALRIVNDAISKML